VGNTLEAASSLVRSSVSKTGAIFGWQRTTLFGLASMRAAPALAKAGLAPASGLVLEAVCARVVDALAKTTGLGRFQPVHDRPGLVRALARTVREVRLAGVQRLPDDLAKIVDAYEKALLDARLADRATVLRFASESPPSAPLVLLDLAVHHALEASFVASLAKNEHLLATVPAGDERSIERLEHALDLRAERHAEIGNDRALVRLQRHLFSAREAPIGTLDDEVSIVSAPGEGRECVEIARLVHREADRGVPFDRMAILLRAPASYRAVLEEALRRARVPAHFSEGSVQPDPSGRAFLALLACAGEQLSARRFAEYLSLGQVPDATHEGTPPPAIPSEERFVPPDEETIPDAMRRASAIDEAPKDDEATGDEGQPVIAGSLRAPRRWEHLLIDAAVIGGRDRWRRRLQGLRNDLKKQRDSLDEPPEDARVVRLARDLDDLDALERFALPLVDSLADLPSKATWGEWIDTLSALATRALDRPERVLSVLAELAPMSPVGPVDLHEVRLVLSQRLRDLVLAPPARRAGKVLVSSIEAARGLSFSVVFVPGLAERIFPQKVAEDPVMRDDERRSIDRSLETNEQRVEAERTALRIAIGAASERVVLSYPRIDMDQSRPRVPSFYGLEVLRAAEGALVGFETLTRRAEQGAASRVGWPAPSSPLVAIDEAEHDLALLASLLNRPESETIGTARFLLSTNESLARALRSRARRWRKPWGSADGLIAPIPEAKTALERHALSARAYSPTALQHFTACPYRFYLYAVHRLAPREEPEAIEEIDPLSRGSLVHEVIYELLDSLREDGKLPVTADTLDEARARLDALVDRITTKYRDDLAPAIDRVWDDGVASIRADLREWLARSLEERTWIPDRFELSFGLEHHGERDASSRDEPVRLECGIQLRGSIDLVEKNAEGALRATDHKTGKVRVKSDAVIEGGASLQPVLYALALEKFFPDTKVVGGRLYYCTSVGGYQTVEIPLEEFARDAANTVAQAIGEALDTPFLPAAPSKGACDWCDYRAVCGPNEEMRVTRVKGRDERLVKLKKLREMP